MYENRRQLLIDWVKTKEFQEIILGHILVGFVSLCVWFFYGLEYGVGSFVLLMFIELNLFHILWNHRDNDVDENKKSLKKATYQQIITIIVAIITIVILFVGFYVISIFIGVDVVSTGLFLIAVSLLLYLSYRVWNVSGQVIKQNNE